ncbi:hypothetical protein BOSE62_40040 [Bosea sp. 62]|nr:hypothetical protein BOSE46_120748 [Bosea sp. 46]VVT59166.1 hypothetical protein BOS5A_201033 [Bosea sp. EC-HK365B]VXB71980.1 hypothetical protein BOSE29B_120059 [Bosea sp. 29B]VXC11567.1 hypothetical protein BOSE125_170054 [Bosea sp. 125]VXC29857.1 hypothetical protein BOSE62_40040 [Bosea sp. 62]VXC75257.1 hypothetical protein BOSE127_40405 [Bosea sp. 127]
MSTTVRTRILRPVANWSWTKSIAQTSFGRVAGARSSRIPVIDLAEAHKGGHLVHIAPDRAGQRLGAVNIMVGGDLEEFALLLQAPEQAVEQIETRGIAVADTRSRPTRHDARRPDLQRKYLLAVRGNAPGMHRPAQTFLPSSTCSVAIQREFFGFPPDYEWPTGKFRVFPAFTMEAVAEPAQGRSAQPSAYRGQQLVMEQKPHFAACSIT